MQLLLVDADLNFRRVLESVLSSGGIRVDGHATPGPAWAAYNSNPADLILVDLPPTLNEVDTFLRKLRGDPKGADVPVVLMSLVHHHQSAEVSRLLKEHRAQTFLPRPFEMFGIAGELRRLCESGGPAPIEKQSKLKNARQRNGQPNIEAGRANREAFRLLKDIWLHQRTGVLRSGNSDSWVLICGGGLQDPSDLDRVEQGLLHGNLEFQQTHQDGTGDALALGSLLWHYAKQIVPVSFEVQLDRRALECSPITARAETLPLNSSTKKVLRAADPHINAAELIRSLSILPQDVSEQLGALKNLGLIHLVSLPEASPGPGKRVQSTAPRAMAPRRPPPPNTTQKSQSQPTGPTPEDVLAHLEAEHGRLKNADDFTILGIAPGSPDSLVRDASERLRERYSSLIQEGNHPKALRARAKTMLHLSQRAEKRILTGREIDDALDDVKPTPEPSAPPPTEQSTEELAYSEGVKAFSAGNYKRAVQCFKKARDERIDSVRNLAWLGWAIFHNNEIPQETRLEEATDMLRLASSFDPAHRQGQFFLAYVENKTGEVEQAEKRLKVLLKKHSDHKEAKKLLHMIQKAKK